MLSMIVAMAENRAIGKNNELLWHLPKDFQHFKSVTMGKPILMGRKTYESIGRPLPGRKNIVITRDADFAAEGVVVVHSIASALEEGKDYDDVMIIGGASFYQQMLPMVDRLYLTVVHESFDGDVFFPEINPLEWNTLETTKHQADEKNQYSFSLLMLERIKKV